MRKILRRRLSRTSPIWLIAAAILGTAGVMSFSMGAPATNARPAAAWADALLDQILLPRPRSVPMRSEGEPSYESQKEALVALGDIGWEETFKRLAGGHGHHVLVEVLARRSLPDNEGEKTRKLLNLLAEKKSSCRRWIPQIIAKMEPVDGNKLLLPYLADPDPEVREACVVSLSCSNAAPAEIEAVIGRLTDSSEAVRFQANTFLERSTGHIPVGDDIREDKAATWSKWWNEQKPADMGKILKRELTNCADLLVNPSQEIRERAGSALIAHSGQTYYGFHQEDPWWGVNNGARSKECWLEWLRLRYSGKVDVENTTWEDEFIIRHPEIPLDVLRATITMNVKDLRSKQSLVRSMARSSIAALLEDSCPFRESRSDPEGDWLNEGIEHWWAQRLKALE